MSSVDKKFLHAFNLLPGIGAQRLRQLAAHFSPLSSAWEADARQLEAAGLGSELARRVIEARPAIDPETEYAKLAAQGIRVITCEESSFPHLLLEISSSPALLYARGELLPQEFCLGMVGARKLSPYGQRAAEHFAVALARSGVTLVSGLAYGADTIAHRSALKLKQRTVAVLGSGLDEKSIYPAANRELARAIEECGCLLSEYPPGTPPLKQHFPARNRIISGLSAGVLVVEASETSGSLITARFALEQNREVFAVPGSIFSPTSAGSNNLIRLGAKCITRIEDILEEFRLRPRTDLGSAPAPENAEEEAIWQQLSSDEPLHIDQLSHLTGIKSAPLSSLLTLMEMKGMVRDLGAMRYIRR